MKVLIADDEAMSRKTLGALLRRHGYEVMEAQEGDEALRLLEAPDAPRLAVLDWAMPGHSGPDVCKAIRAKAGRYAYVILVTTRGGKVDLVAGLDAGADDFIPKPYDQAELLARMRVAQRVLGLEAGLVEKIASLEQALSHVKLLQGLLPICMHCRRVRSSEEQWQRLDGYLQEHSHLTFTHGLCKDCLEKHYPKDSEVTP